MLGERSWRRSHDHGWETWVQREDHGFVAGVSGPPVGGLGLRPARIERSVDRPYLSLEFAKRGAENLLQQVTQHGPCSIRCGSWSV